LHLSSLNRDFLPTDDIEKLINTKPKELSVENPDSISRFLGVFKNDTRFLYCMLTRKKVNNTVDHATRHVDGWHYKRKMYEFWKTQMLKKKKVLEIGLQRVRRKIENE